MDDKIGCTYSLTSYQFEKDTYTLYKERSDRLYRDNREISLHVQRRIRVDVGHVFGVKTNPYLKIKYTIEIFHQPAVKL